MAEEPKWITEWKSTPHPKVTPEETRDRLRSQALAQPEMRAIMERFPPLCLVRAKPGVSLALPGPGDVGFVTAYGDPFGNAGPGGNVTVRLHKPKRVRGHNLEAAVCHIEELEVVGYRKGLTPGLRAGDVQSELRSSRPSAGKKGAAGCHVGVT